MCEMIGFRFQIGGGGDGGGGGGGEGGPWLPSHYFPSNKFKFVY